MGTAKIFGKCGFLAILVMLITGTLFGGLGVFAAHLWTKHASAYYLLLLPVILLALILGFGLSFGAKFGRCSRFSAVTFGLVFLFAIGAYGAFLFGNQYHDAFPTPPTLLEESVALSRDTWNMIAAIPGVAPYLPPLQTKDIQDALRVVPVLADYLPPAEAAPEATATEPAAVPPHLGVQLWQFVQGLPAQATTPATILIGTIFDLAIFAPIKDSLEYPGLTRWIEVNGASQLVFDEQAVRPWMVWAGEFGLLWGIILLFARRGVKKASAKLMKRMGGRDEQAYGKKGKDYQKAGKSAPTGKLDLTPRQVSAVETVPAAEVAPPKKKGGWFFGRKKSAAPDGDKAAEPKKKGGWFRRKAKTEGVQTSPEKATAQIDTSSDVEFELPTDQSAPAEQLYALILHQYSPTRETDLLRLIQQVSQVSDERARKLLKVPSLLKREVTTKEADVVINKFNQVQAQVKLITMQQLEELQKKQMPATPPRPQAQAAAPQPAAKIAADDGEQYALILRKFDPAQRKPVLELLASISNTPVTQLQQSLKTPALVLRDASKDEVTMIAQQFAKIPADVKMLSMPELQKLMNKK